MSISAILVALTCGCATVLTPVPDSEYAKLEEVRTYHVVTKSGEKRTTSKQSVNDSTLVIIKPAAGLHDPRRYPVSIPLNDIESISTVRYESLVYIESGVQAGKNYGDYSLTFSPYLFTAELGYLSGERRKAVKPPTGYGATMYFAGSSHDFRGGIKARVRYRFNNSISVDAAGGPLLGNNSGFVSSVGVNLGSAVTFKSEWMSAEFEPWTEVVYPTRIHHPGGTEQIWYNGIMLRNGLGWMAMTLEIGVGIAMVMAVMSGLSQLN